MCDLFADLISSLFVCANKIAGIKKRRLLRNSVSRQVKKSIRYSLRYTWSARARIVFTRTPAAGYLGHRVHTRRAALRATFPAQSCPRWRRRRGHARRRSRRDVRLEYIVRQFPNVRGRSAETSRGCEHRRGLVEERGTSWDVRETFLSVFLRTCAERGLERPSLMCAAQKMLGGSMTRLKM